MPRVPPAIPRLRTPEDVIPWSRDLVDYLQASIIARRVIVLSPDGSEWLIKVSNAGALSAEKVVTP